MREFPGRSKVDQPIKREQPLYGLCFSPLVSVDVICRRKIQGSCWDMVKVCSRERERESERERKRKREREYLRIIKTFASETGRLYLGRKHLGLSSFLVPLE